MASHPNVDRGDGSDQRAAPAASELVETVRRMRSPSEIETPPGSGLRPFIVGLDGQSGAGKSTLAATARSQFGKMNPSVSCTIIQGDDFYAGGSKAEWDERSAEEKATLVIDWHRQAPVLAALRGGESGQFHGFDWQAFDGRLEEQATICPSADVVILEGAYSCRPELHDLLDLRVLLAAPDNLRFDRLGQREGDAYRDSWFARWSEAEEHYFGTVMPPSAFDLVLEA